MTTLKQCKINAKLNKWNQIKFMFQTNIRSFNQCNLFHLSMKTKSLQQQTISISSKVQNHIFHAINLFLQLSATKEFMQSKIWHKSNTYQTINPENWWKKLGNWLPLSFFPLSLDEEPSLEQRGRRGTLAANLLTPRFMARKPVKQWGSDWKFENEKKGFLLHSWPFPYSLSVWCG